MTTIAEFYENNKTLFLGNDKLTFIGDFVPYKEKTCIKWFNQEWRKMLDNYFLCNYYDYNLLFDNETFLKTVIGNVFDVNAHKYDKMYGAIFYYDYNPLWNVDGLETTTTTFGKIVNKTEIGETNGTNTIATRNGSSTNKVNGYNDLTDELKTDNQNEWINNGATDSFHNDEAENTNTTSEHVDTMTHERQGNIGVTKSSELLSDSVALYKANNLISEIANDIKSKILLGVF